MGQELMDDRSRLALHEASHAAASRLLGRRIAGVSINGNGGATEADLVRGDASPSEAGFLEALDDLTVLLVANVVMQRIEPRNGFISHEPGSDEERAQRAAQRIAGSPGEIAALVELGRERARTMVERADFAELVAVLWPLIYRHGGLSAEEVNTHLNTKENLNGKGANLRVH
jgi:hypothetical protein